MEDTSRRMKVRGNVADAFGLMSLYTTSTLCGLQQQVLYRSTVLPGRCRPIDGLYILSTSKRMRW